MEEEERFLVGSSSSSFETWKRSNTHVRCHGFWLEPWILMIRNEYVWACNWLSGYFSLSLSLIWRGLSLCFITSKTPRPLASTWKCSQFLSKRLYKKHTHMCLLRNHREDTVQLWTVMCFRSIGIANLTAYFPKQGKEDYQKVMAVGAQGKRLVSVIKRHAFS